jgi:hypothetical protein
MIVNSVKKWLDMLMKRRNGNVLTYDKKKKTFHLLAIFSTSRVDEYPVQREQHVGGGHHHAGGGKDGEHLLYHQVTPHNS